MDGSAIYRREAEIGLLLLKNRPLNSWVTFLLCFKPYTGLGFPSGTRQQQQINVHLDNKNAKEKKVSAIWHRQKKVDGDKNKSI